MSNNRHWLSIAEYVSIAGSVIGSAVAVVSQQAIYGLAPISVSLVLNLINRHRLEQRSHQDSAASTQVQQLKSAINSLNLASTKIQRDFENFVPKQELASVVSAIETLNQRHNGLRSSLVPLQSQLDDLIEQFNKRPELEQIESLATVIAALKQYIDELPHPDRLQQESGTLQQQLESALLQVSQNSERVEYLENAIAQVQQQLGKLGDRE